MDISNQHPESSRYISKDAPGKTSKSSSRYLGGDISIAAQSRQFITDDRGHVADRRQGVATNRTQPEQHHQPRWNDFATTVHDLLCAAPCFVGSIDGMGNASPTASATFTLPVDNTTSARAALMDAEEEDMLASSIHETPTPPFPSRYPNLPQAAGGADEDVADSLDFFDSSRNNLAGRHYLAAKPKPPSDQGSIYRTPSSLSAVPSIAASDSKFRQRSLASYSQCSSTSESHFAGLYRSPAWSHDHSTDDDDEVLSVEEDDDEWQAFVPVHNTEYRRIQTSQGSKSVIDVTYMEDMFNDFNVNDHPEQHLAIR